MAEEIQAMPSLKDLCEGKYTYKQWLTYYKNVWTRNLMARCIDVQTDTNLKSKDPEEKVISDQGQEVSVKARLEYRKMLVQDAIDLIAGIDTLLAIDDADFESKILSKEALAVAEDMKPKTVGQACTTEDGKDGRYEETVAAKDGQPAKLVCIPKDVSVEDYLKSQVEAKTTISPKPEETKPETETKPEMETKQ